MKDYVKEARLFFCQRFNVDDEEILDTDEETLSTIRLMADFASKLTKELIEELICEKIENKALIERVNELEEEKKNYGIV